MTEATPVPPPTAPLEQTARTRLRRRADRGRFDRDLVNAVLDEAYIAHVGFVVDGEPRVLPMTYGRDGELLYLHGAPANAMLGAAADTAVCVTVTLLDGLVLARSAFHHSMNYRSVVLLGTATKVEALDEKERAAEVTVEHVLRGRSQVARASDPSELRATFFLRLPIEEGSAKVRVGDPVDEPEDMDFPAWAGVVPLRLEAGEPVQAADQARGDLVAPTAVAISRAQPVA